MRFILFASLLVLSACAARQPEPQTAAVDELVEELNLLPPPTQVVQRPVCADVIHCMETGTRTLVRER